MSYFQEILIEHLLCARYPVRDENTKLKCLHVAYTEVGGGGLERRFISKRLFCYAMDTKSHKKKTRRTEGAETLRKPFQGKGNFEKHLTALRE